LADESIVTIELERRRTMKDGKGFLGMLHHYWAKLPVVVLIAFLFIALGCGGGGSGGEDGPTGDDPPADNNDPPADEDETDAPKFDGFDFVLSEGDFWEYQWDSYVNKWAQGSGGSTTETDGTFRVTLRSSRAIDGVTAYEVYLSGIPGSSNAGFAPRWKYIAVADNKILGSEDGETLSTIFDAQEGAWAGGGFFISFLSDYLYTAQDGNISNDYITGPCITAGRSAKEDQCEYFPGIGTICGDSSLNFQQYEYYMEGIGPAGYHYYNSYSSCGGGFCSGGTREYNVGLAAASLRGDTVDYDLEPFEMEPNDSPAAAQSIDLFNGITGFIRESDPGTEMLLDGGSYGTYSATVGDWYSITLDTAVAVKITLDFTGSKKATDIDLFLFDSSGAVQLGQSFEDNPATGDYTEIIKQFLDAGTYVIGLQAFKANAKEIYTLTFQQ
jgi:hypothetical protein